MAACFGACMGACAGVQVQLESLVVGAEADQPDQPEPAPACTEDTAECAAANEKRCKKQSWKDRCLVTCNQCGRRACTDTWHKCPELAEGCDAISRKNQRRCCVCGGGEASDPVPAPAPVVAECGCTDRCGEICEDGARRLTVLNDI